MIRAVEFFSLLAGLFFLIWRLYALDEWLRNRKKERNLARKEAKRALEGADIHDIEDVLALHPTLPRKLREHLQRRCQELRADRILRD